MDPFTASLLAAGIGKTFGKVAGMFSKVEDPMTHYKKLNSWIRDYDIPGELDDGQIRDMVGGAVPLKTSMVTQAGSSAKASMANMRNRRALVAQVSNSVNIANSTIRIEGMKNKLRTTMEVLSGSAKQAELSQKFKSGLMDAAAQKSINSYIDQVKKKQAIESIAGTVGMLGAYWGMAGFPLPEGGELGGNAGGIGTTQIPTGAPGAGIPTGKWF